MFAHKEANYVIEEPRTIQRAWGPIQPAVTTYLYWDLNLLTGGLSRGVTTKPPMYTSSPPSNPVPDQHWFDTVETVMRIWNGTKWIEKVRVFAGYIAGGSAIHPYGAGESQAGIVGDFEGGNLVLDSYNKPLRQSNGTFVTTSTDLLVVNTASKKIKFETEVLSGMAAEPLPKFTLVQIRPGRRLIPARPANYMTRITGIVVEDLDPNEVGIVVSDGLIRNEGWNFPPEAVDRPVFAGPNGEVTLIPPQVGVCQAAGVVYDADSIYMDVMSPIILDDITVYTPPPPVVVPPGTPIADFYASSTSGAAPLSVDFTSMALGSPTSFEWDFTNDGSVDLTTTNTTVSHTFATPGVYSVRMRAINGTGYDDEIKSSLITVTAPALPSTTNLGIRLGGPSQVQRGSTFNISVVVTNDGLIPATNVSRVLTIPNVAGHQILVSNLPAGSTIDRQGNKTIVTLPEILTLPSGANYGPSFVSITAPVAGEILVLFAVVQSPELDVTPGDNTASLSIRVKP